MSVPLRLVFLGSDPIALPLLEWLSETGATNAKVVAVFTQPDRPVGRGQKIEPNEIKRWAGARQLPVFQLEKLTDDARAQLAALEADVALVMAYGHILRDEFIATPRLGTLNLHTSLLPKYRGASPIQTAIACGERETGVTLMRIVRRLDAGPVADAERATIAPLDTAADLEAKLAAACVPLLARALPRLAAGTLTFVDQEDHAATFCRKLTKEDGTLDFSLAATALAARINGLFPWPCCRFQSEGEWIRVGLADAFALSPPALPFGAGEVLGADADGLLIGTGTGVLRLRRLQRAGGKMLPAPDFLRGFPIRKGEILASLPQLPLLKI